MAGHVLGPDELVAIHDARQSGVPWVTIAEPFRVSGEVMRGRYRRALEGGEVAAAVERAKREAPEPAIQGVRAAELVDTMALWTAAEARYERDRAAAEAAAQRVQRIVFNEGPVCITHIGDLHCGGSGVNYPLAREHAELVRDTPGMYLAVVGDLIDNFVLAWAYKIRMGTEVTIPQEWGLVRQWLSWCAPKIVAVVDGNHDAWTTDLSGIDYYREVIAAARPDALYARDDLRFTLAVGGAEWPYRMRHKWAGYSIYNPTHGAERGQKWDQDFLVGVGAHTHTGAFFRTFNAAGRAAAAIQVNTYKELDAYPRREGFPVSTHDKPVAVIYTDSGEMIGTTSIHAAAEMMKLFYRGKRAA